MRHSPITSSQCIAVLVRAGFRLAGALNGDAVLHHRGVPVLVPVRSALSPEELNVILRSAHLDASQFEELLEQVSQSERAETPPRSEIRLKGPVGATG